MSLLLFLGLAAIIASFVVNTPTSPVQKLSGVIRIAGFVLLALGALSKAVIQIDPGQVGVQSLFGNVQERTLPSGLSVVNPLVEVKEFDIKTQNYTMSGVNDAGNAGDDDAIKALSQDGLEVTIDLTVLYRIIPSSAPSIYRELGTSYRDLIVRPIARTRIRDLAANYEAVSLYSSKREEFQSKIFEAIDSDFTSRGLVLEQLLVRNITLPESVKKAIESKINAEQDAQKMEFVLQKEQQEAERKRVEARGIADYQEIIASTLTSKQLQYESILAQKELSLSPNAKVVIMGSGKGNILISQ
ncbi:prohibitin family protein [Arcticibacterium luteifluviistationis]|uniref:Band 7 protein n=1 Tax=Arcticibacterium luteifluviistationis TaxID=1784714 RepID=A0A2Z4GGV1_9BACT|nr:prohibitin family protein [Arcticibacterium luteifluviistationis]AWW00159.1 band 7 protein [Arcticibacterium luteifluviistationis]